MLWHYTGWSCLPATNAPRLGRAIQQQEFLTNRILHHTFAFHVCLLHMYLFILNVIFVYSSWPLPRPMAEKQTVRLHRCRFIDWSPSPITALAFPPAVLSPRKFLPNVIPVLAVGRANGNIEIWKWAGPCPPNKMHQGWVICQVCAFCASCGKPLDGSKTGQPY